jgi:predicted ATPase
MWQGVDLQARSHGESFLEVLRQRFTDVGVYFLDEPESALSFQSSLALVALLAVLASEGSQVVCATHTPLLCSLPGATVLEVGEHGIRPAQWEELDLVRHWRGFLEAPGRYLRHLTD